MKRYPSGVSSRSLMFAEVLDLNFPLLKGGSLRVEAVDIVSPSRPPLVSSVLLQDGESIGPLANGTSAVAVGTIHEHFKCHECYPFLALSYKVSPQNSYDTSFVEIDPAVQKLWIFPFFGIVTIS